MELPHQSIRLTNLFFNRYYNVQRSSDNDEFESIIHINKTEGDGIKTYAYTDTTNHILGSVLYKLLSVDVDGQINQLCNILNVRANTLGIIKAYPNPIDKILFLSVEGYEIDTDVNISIFDNLGMIIYLHTIKVDRTGFVEKINTQNWASGIYYIKTVINGSFSVNKIQKE